MWSGIIQSSDYDHQKYVKLCRLVDGRDQCSEIECKVDLDNFKSLKKWFHSVSAAVSMLSRLPRDCCSLCSAIVGCTLVRHGHSGCPRIFNHCYKCIGKHAGSACSSPLFKVPKGFCWTCWMPLQSFFGFTFHSDCVGALCDSPARDVLKHLAIIFFNNRHFAPTVACTAGSSGEYGKWLFHTSESVAGEGQVPNILRLLMATLQHWSVDALSLFYQIIHIHVTTFQSVLFNSKPFRIRMERYATSCQMPMCKKHT